MKDDLIHIACAIDNAYAKHCACMILSLLDHCPSDVQERLQIHIITDGLEKGELRKFKRTVRNKCVLKFYTIDNSVLKDAPLSHHLTLSTYYRILLPRILDENIEKVLYLDSDLIVRHDINELWNVNVSSDYIVASREYIPQSHLNNIRMSENSKYFNAGILLINLRKWREEAISNALIEFIAKNPEKLTFHDQDALNIYFENNWVELSKIWNVPSYFYDPVDYSMYFECGIESYLECIVRPKIVHFTGSLKPWYSQSIHPYKYEYFQYLKQTEWKENIGFREIFFLLLRRLKCLFTFH